MSPGLITLLAGPAILIPLAGYAIARRRVRGAGWYAVLLLSIAFWSLAYAWELSAQLHATKLLALRIKYLAVVLLPSGWIGFILAFVGSPAEHVRRRVLPWRPCPRSCSPSPGRTGGTACSGVGSRSSRSAGMQ